jgi:hypothetical protein
VGGGEATGLKVEIGQPRFEVDVEPLTTSDTGVLGSNGNQPRADAVAQSCGGNDGVEDEGMRSAVPHDVDEPHEDTVLPTADPSEALSFDLDPPINVGIAVTAAEAIRMQGTDRCILEIAAPLVCDGPLSECGSGSLVGKQITQIPRGVRQEASPGSDQLELIPRGGPQPPLADLENRGAGGGRDDRRVRRDDDL